MQTPGEMSPEEAQRRVASPNHGALPDAALRIVGRELGSSSNGGTQEMQFPDVIPPQYLEVVSP